MHLAEQQIIQLMDSNMDVATRVIMTQVKIWYLYELFSWQWWVGVTLSILPWVIWYIFSRKRPDFSRLLYVAFVVMVIALCLDILGDQTGLWHYRYSVIPLVPTFFPFDLTLVPLSALTMLQVFPRIHPFIKGTAYALLSSYVGEPFFHAIAVYNLVHWKYLYSVPIQLGIYLVCNAIYQNSRKFQLPKS